MARIRTVKPTIWGDAKFAGLSRDARLLVIGLISAADDAGRFIASAAAIAGAVFPHDELPAGSIRKWRDEIAATGLIELYRVGGGEYGWFPKWRTHQKINRPGPSALPAPPGYDGDPGPAEPPDDDEHHSDSLNGSRNAHGASRESFTGGKGREGKGRESPSPRAERGGICAKHTDEPGPNCRACGTNTRAVNRAAKLAAVPDWCGTCDEGSRLLELDDGRMRRCPTCHPSVRAS